MTAKNNKIKRRILLFIWLIFGLVIIGLPTYFISVKNDFLGLYGGLPSLSELENPENDLSSTLYFASGEPMGKYFRYNRSRIDYNELSPELVNTLIASEDHRFRQHTGIDVIGLARAVVGKLTFKYAGGGSTITMQLSENLFRTMTENAGILYRIPLLKELIIKSKEWIIATQLEKNFTKDEIFALYLNTVPFGSNAFGIKSASETFFDKQPIQLNYPESAVLIGMLQGTTSFNPFTNPEQSKNKRNQVLSKVYRHGHLEKDEYDSLKLSKIDLSNYNVASQNTGSATYFREVIKNDLLRFCKQNNIDLFEAGLKIYTTIDKDLQTYAETSMSWWMDSLQGIFLNDWAIREQNPWVDEDGVEIKGFIEKVVQRTEHYRKLKKKFGNNKDSIFTILNKPKAMRVFSWSGDIDTIMSPMDSLRYYKKFLQSGFMAMDAHTGHIKAWVGGINHKYFKYDHVKQGKNQPGSTFKPIVYATAIDNGYYPCYEVSDERKSYETGGEPPIWTPSNASGKFTGEMMTIRKGMAQSKNSITSKIMSLIGPENVVKKARALGIKSDLAPVLALCLGVSDVSVYEMVGAYGAFVNGGTYTEPYYISRIEDKNGEIIHNPVPEQKQALSEDDAYIMLHMLKGTLEEEGGTARRLDYEWNLLSDDNEIGAKTGTTQNYSDGWFMGVTKDLVAGAWVGGDDRAIHFPSITHGQGAVMALPIWAKFMEQVYKNDSLGYTKGPFPKPESQLSVTLDCSKYGSVIDGEEIDSLSNDADIQQVELDESGLF